MNYIYLIFILELILFFFSYVLSNKDIMAPPVVFVSMFVISTLFALINCNKWGIKFGIETVGILAIGILTFVITYVGATLFSTRIRIVARRKAMSPASLTGNETLKIKTKVLINFF